MDFTNATHLGLLDWRTPREPPGTTIAHSLLAHQLHPDRDPVPTLHTPHWTDSDRPDPSPGTVVVAYCGHVFTTSRRDPTDAERCTLCARIYAHLFPVLSQHTRREYYFLHATREALRDGTDLPDPTDFPL